MRAGHAVEEVGEREERAAGGAELVEHLAHVPPPFLAWPAPRPDHREIFVERHGEIDHPSGPRPGNQLGRELRVGDGQTAALAPRPPGMLGRQKCKERPRCRQAPQVRGALHPHHPPLAAGLVGRHGEVRQRPHARTIESERHHATVGEVLHRGGRRRGPARRFFSQGRRHKPLSFRKRLVEIIGVVAAEEDDVAGAEPAVGHLPFPHHFRADQYARSVLGTVAPLADVDHAGLAAELPDRHLLAGYEPHRPGAWKTRVGGRHEVRGGVPLRAGVLVDDEHVAMAAAAAECRGGDHRHRRHSRRPDTGELRGDGERQVANLIARHGDRLPDHERRRGSVVVIGAAKDDPHEQPGERQQRHTQRSKSTSHATPPGFSHTPSPR